MACRLVSLSFVFVFSNFVVFEFSQGKANEAPRFVQEKSPKVGQTGLGVIYSTIGGIETKAIPRDDPEVDRVYRELVPFWKISDPDIFLVRAHNLAEAISEMDAVLRAAKSRMWLELVQNDEKKQTAWLAVYLGCAASSPPVWTLDSVKLDGKRLRVSYSRPERFDSTADLVPYFALAPLGQIEAGDWIVELHHAKKNKVMLTRTVEVSVKAK